MDAVTLVTLALLMTALPLIVARRYGLLRFAGPLYVVAASVFLGVTVKTVANLAAPGRGFYSAMAPVQQDVLRGYLYALLFILMLSIGYAAAARGVPTKALSRRIATTAVVLQDRHMLAIAAASTALFVVTAVFYLGEKSAGIGLRDVLTLDNLQRLNVGKLDISEGSGGFGLSYGYIAIFFSLLSMSLSILVSQLYLRKASFTTVASVGLVSCLIVLSALIRGKRGDLLDVAGILIVLHFCFRQRVNIRMLSRTLVGGLAIVVLFGFMTSLRTARDADDSTSSVINETTFDQVLFSTYFFDINVIAAIVDNMQTDDLKYGSTYKDWVIGLIPRPLWPEKPAISLGLYVRTVIFKWLGTIGGINPTMAGEAFINFSWFGALAGLLYGAGFRRLEEWLLGSRMLKFAGGPWLYAALIFPLVWSLAQSSFSIVVVGFLVKMALAAGACVALREIGGRSRTVTNQAGMGMQTGLLRRFHGVQAVRRFSERRIAGR